MQHTSVSYSTATEFRIQPPDDHCLQWFEKENVQLVILDPVLDSELVELLRSQPGWNLDSEDKEVVIFTLPKGR
jgi:hypothetical protein